MEKENGLIRLQEEIMRNFHDDSILAWGLDTEMHDPLGSVPYTVEYEMRDEFGLSPILASSPKDFRSCGDLKYAAEPNSAFTMTNLGLQMQLPLVPVLGPRSHDPFGAPDHIHGWIGLLGCSPGTNSTLLGIILCSVGEDYESNKKVERVQIGSGGHTYHTVVVGPRAATSVPNNRIGLSQSDYL
jgi:hypothetical protein